MRTLFLSVAAVALLGGCGERTIKISDKDGAEGKPLKVVNQLQCPEHQGALTRVRTAPDGLSCDYVGPRGAEVTLRLVKVEDEDGAAALTPIERELNTLLPGVAERLDAADAKAKAESAKAEAEAAKAEAEADRVADMADREAAKAERAAERASRRAERAAERAARGRDRDENVDVNLPGVSVKTEGDRTRVSLPGIHVDTTEDGGAHVNIGGVRIDADDNDDGGSGRVRVNSNGEQVDIRAQDDASEIRSRKAGSGVRATYILVDERGPTWRLVGYEARGPSSGPLVVAVVKSKSRKDDDVFNAAKDLVRANAGG